MLIRLKYPTPNHERYLDLLFNFNALENLPLAMYLHIDLHAEPCPCVRTSSSLAPINNSTGDERLQGSNTLVSPDLIPGEGVPAYNPLLWKSRSRYENIHLDVIWHVEQLGIFVQHVFPSIYFRCPSLSYVLTGLSL
jgi:hypothetical protein